MDRFRQGHDMRFALSSLDRPRKLAKRLRALLAASGIEVTLHRSQHLVAGMFGYRDWQELASSAGREGTADDDLACDAVTAEARRAWQVGTLVRGGVPNDLAETAVAALHPTSVAGPRAVGAALGISAHSPDGLTAIVGREALESLMAIPAATRRAAGVHVLGIDHRSEPTSTLVGPDVRILVVPPDARPWDTHAAFLAGFMADRCLVVVAGDRGPHVDGRIHAFLEAYRVLVYDRARSGTDGVPRAGLLDLRRPYRAPATLGGYGFPAPQLSAIRAPAGKLAGLSFVTGPTGSGRSTLVWAIAADAVARGRRVVAVGPLPGPDIRGVMRLEGDLAEAMRRAEALAPDMIVTGRIHEDAWLRDLARASLSGMAVWLTYYTGSVMQALGHLRYPDGETAPGRDVPVSRIVATRLIRTPCTHCRVGVREAVDQGYVDRAAAELAASLVRDPSRIRYASRDGCRECRSGWAGRMMVSETLSPDDAFNRLHGEGRFQEAYEHWMGPLGGSSLTENAVVEMAKGTLDPREVEDKCGLLDEIDPGRVLRLLPER